MPTIQWTQEMSVGIQSIDADHQILVGMVNRLDDAIKAARGKDSVSSILDALLDYTTYHFGREEALMQACGYPDLDAHRHTHKVLRTQVAHIRDRYVGNPETIHDREVLAFLKNWLTSHIMGRDKLYAPFMSSRRDAVAKAEAAYAERLGREPELAALHDAGTIA
jgi:hemerythrin-like metal-binding protein